MESRERKRRAAAIAVAPKWILNSALWIEIECHPAHMRMMERRKRRGRRTMPPPRKYRNLIIGSGMRGILSKKKGIKGR
jgi:hypothetical protein